ncbi:MAG: hypothetical protein SWH68_07435 [Thermodesulfobacteriota bacterium]|nr:hypothetical protein [Thermodesulfobacteriota bacterium]
MRQILNQAGFINITITPKKDSDTIIKDWNVAEGAEKMVFSAYIKAEKPAGV